MQDITASLSDDQLKMLLDLAEKRGVDANTVLQQAITTESLLSENVGKGDEVIIKKSDNSLSKVVFDQKG